MVITPVSIVGWLLYQPVYREASTQQWAWINRQLHEAFRFGTYRVWTDAGRIVAVVTWKLLHPRDVEFVRHRQWVDHWRNEGGVADDPVVFITNMALTPGFKLSHIKRELRRIPAQGILWWREDQQCHFFPRQRGFRETRG